MKMKATGLRMPVTGATVAVSTVAAGDTFYYNGDYYLMLVSGQALPGFPTPTAAIITTGLLTPFGGTELVIPKALEAVPV